VSRLYSYHILVPPSCCRLFVLSSVQPRPPPIHTLFPYTTLFRSLCRDCHGKCRTFKSRMGSVVSVDSHLFLGAGYTSEYRLSYTAVCIYYYSCISSWFTYDLSSF